MTPTSEELAAEQAYFDHAHKHRERRRALLGDAPAAAANPGAAKRLLAWMKRKESRPQQEAVAFGRIDDEALQPLYIGYEVIADEDHEILVINWRTPAAAPYYQATHEDPRGLVRKRTFMCEGNRIVDFEDVVFQQLARDIAALEALDATSDPLLLAELDRARDGAMRDIVRTIQASQFKIIRAPMDQVLVIEGGPGTGKTAVALHRVSWLLFNERSRLTANDILVVGPHPAFTRYIRTVLPDLGDDDVAHQDIGQLAPAVRRGRSEPADVRRIKGEARTARLLARALDGRIGTPEVAERMLFDGRFVTLSGAEVAAAVQACREAGGPYAQRRRLLRARLLDLVRQRGAPADRERLEPVDNLVERLWPQMSAPAFLRGLLGSKARLAAAGDDDFTAADLGLLHRRGADRLSEEIWSSADLALLDEAEELITGPPRRFAHIVVDEAQDLSPMQLRSIARRSATGSFTLVGDLAQSTGPWARDSWDDVLALLPATLPPHIETLRHGYRVPRQVYEFAAALLPIAAPGVEPAIVVRDGPADPTVHRVGAAERAARAVSIAMAHAAAGRFVGVVCPPAYRSELEEAFAANEGVWSSADSGELTTSINVLSPPDAKGLEFDAVVVVEPEDIVAADERGHRMLFMALTRTTRYLDIVCVGEPLPVSVPVPGRVPSPRTLPDPTVDDATLDRLAGEVAALVTGGAPAPLWEEVLHRAAALLDAQAQRNTPTGRHHRRD